MNENEQYSLPKIRTMCIIEPVSIIGTYDNKYDRLFLNILWEFTKISWNSCLHICNKYYVTKTNFKYEFQEGYSWTWYRSQQPFEFTNWCPGQPNNPDTEHCLHLYTYASAGCDFKWNDFDCNQNSTSLLEIPAINQIMKPLCQKIL